MDEKDKESFGQFGLTLGGAIIGLIISSTFEQQIIKYSLILICSFILFLIYTWLVGRPWPRSYNKVISCNGTDEEVNKFFQMYYYDFENQIEEKLDVLFKSGFPQKTNAYLTLDNNKIKIESENVKWLETTSSLTLDIVKSLKIENITISDTNFQNALTTRPIKNLQFRASYTKIYFFTKLSLKDMDLEGIYNAAKAMGLKINLEKSSNHQFYWPDEKEFLYVKPNKKGLIRKIAFYYNTLKSPEINYNFPFIRKHMITLNNNEKTLIYEVTINAKWGIPLNRVDIFSKEAIEEFNQFLNLWNQIDNKIAVKHRFKNAILFGLIVRDGLDASCFAKKMTIVHRKIGEDD